MARWPHPPISVSGSMTLQQHHLRSRLRSRRRCSPRPSRRNRPSGRHPSRASSPRRALRRLRCLITRPPRAHRTEACIPDRPSQRSRISSRHWQRLWPAPAPPRRRLRQSRQRRRSYRLLLEATSQPERRSRLGRRRRCLPTAPAFRRSPPQNLTFRHSRPRSPQVSRDWQERRFRREGRAAALQLPARRATRRKPRKSARVALERAKGRPGGIPRRARHR